MNVGLIEVDGDGRPVPGTFLELVTCGHLTKGACRSCIIRCWPRNDDGTLAERGDKGPEPEGGDS